MNSINGFLSRSRAFLWLALIVTSLVLAQSALADSEVPQHNGTILVLGDSLSAAYGIDRSEGWVALLQNRLIEQGYKQQVTNASISGETTAGGLRRLPKQLNSHNPQLVIVELGANDGLRGQSLKAMRQNLEKIVTKSQAHGANVLLLGMYIPANYGKRYVEKFHAIYGELAEQYNTGLVDFMLAPIAFDESKFLKDRIHPNAEAQPALLEHLWPQIATQLGKLAVQ